METSTRLRQTVADFFQVEEAAVGPSFSLQSRQGSIARSALDAAIRRRVGVKSQAVYSARTFGELASELGVDPSVGVPTSVTSPSPARIPSNLSSTPGLASCGIDIELIEHIPIANDPWEDAFYRANFAPSEIAYCLRQPEPSLHFAARWSAKEALKKADRSFLMAEGKDIEVVADDSGAPHLVFHSEGSARRLPHAVSLSHTTHAAVAVVVRVDLPSPGPAPVIAVPVVSAPIEVVPSPRTSRRPAMVLVLLNLIALALGAFALYRTSSR